MLSILCVRVTFLDVTHFFHILSATSAINISSVWIFISFFSLYTSFSLSRSYIATLFFSLSPLHLILKLSIPLTLPPFHPPSTPIIISNGTLIRLDFLHKSTLNPCVIFLPYAFYLISVVINTSQLGHITIITTPYYCHNHHQQQQFRKPHIYPLISS